MSDRPRITLEELAADQALLGPWYSGDPPAPDARAASPKDAAGHCIAVLLNADDGAKGIVRILVQTAEEKRLTRCYLDAMLDQPKLRAMVKRKLPEVIHLHGGLRVVIDTNEARLTRDVVATIVLDATVDKPIAFRFIKYPRDEADYEVQKQAILDRMVAEGRITDGQRGRVFFCRWAYPGELGAKTPVSLFELPTEPGPPSEPERRPSIAEQQAAIEAKQEAAARQREAEERYAKAVDQRQREVINEKIADHFRRIRQRGV